MNFPADCLPAPFECTYRCGYETDRAPRQAAPRIAVWDFLNPSHSLVFGVYKHKLGLWHVDARKQLNQRVPDGRKNAVIHPAGERFEIDRAPRRTYATIEKAAYGLLDAAKDMGGVPARCEEAKNTLKSRCDMVREGGRKGQLSWDDDGWDIVEHICGIPGIIDVSRQAGSFFTTGVGDCESKARIRKIRLRIYFERAGYGHIFSDSDSGKTYTCRHPPDPSKKIMFSADLGALYRRYLALASSRPEGIGEITGHERMIFAEFVRQELRLERDFDDIEAGRGIHAPHKEAD